MRSVFRRHAVNRHLSLITLLTLLFCSFLLSSTPTGGHGLTAAAQSGPYRVKVCVADDGGRWVTGAQVQLRDITPTHQTTRELYDAGQTDGFGCASVDVSAEGTFRIEVSKTGYVYRKGTRDGETHEAIRHIVLSPKAKRPPWHLVTIVKGTLDDRFTATLLVTDAANQEGVAGARVLITNNLALSERYESTTGASGRASFEILKKGIGASYSVDISHKGYREKRVQFDSPGRGETKLELPASLERTDDYYSVRLLITAVRASDNSPVVGARVYATNADSTVGGSMFSEQTNASGQAVLNIDRSGNYRVEVTHSNFRTQGNSKIVQVARFSDNREIPVDIRLHHKQDAAPPEDEEGEKGAAYLPKTLRVDVLDAETGARVEGAEVCIKLRDGRRFGECNFSPQGEMLSFDLAERGDVKADDILNGLTLEVTQWYARGGKRVVAYSPANEEVSSERLRRPGPIGLNIRLTKTEEGKKAEEEAKGRDRKLEEAEKELKKKAEEAKLRKEFADELARLRAEFVAFDNEKKQLMQSAIEVANRGMAIETDANSATHIIANLRAEVDKVQAAAEACRLAEQVKARIASNAAEAEREEESVRKQLDYGERLVSECKDEFGAQTAKNNYRAARDSLLQISRVFMDAKEKNAALQQARRGGSGDAPRQKLRADDIETNSTRAQRAAEEMRKYLAQLQALEAKLTSAAPVLRGRILARVAEWRRTPLPEDLVREVDGLEVLASAVKLSPSEYDFSRKWPAVADELLPRLKQMQAEAASIIAASENACAGGGSFNADEEVARLERVWIGLGVEVGAAEGLAKKADECLAKLKNASGGGDPTKASGGESPTVEEIPEGTPNKGDSASSKGGSTSGNSSSAPPVVEEIPEEPTNKGGGAPGGATPAVEEIPETSVASNNPPAVEEIPETPVNRPSTNSSSSSRPTAQSQPAKPEKKKGGGINWGKVGAALGGAIRQSMGGQPPPGQPQPGGGGGGGTYARDMSGTWIVNDNDGRTWELAITRTSANTWTAVPRLISTPKADDWYGPPGSVGDTIIIVSDGPGTFRARYAEAKNLHSDEFWPVVGTYDDNSFSVGSYYTGRRKN